MKKIPQVDILIITYNQKAYIAEAIDSAINQDYPNKKIIIADDASTDETPNIIKKYAEKYPNLVIPAISPNNGGITANSNYGLSFCKGDFLVHMGGDDILLASKLTKQVEWFNHNPNAVICGHLLYTCNENSTITGKYAIQKKSGKGSKVWIEHGTIYGAISTMIRSSSIPEYGYDKRIKWVSDWKLYIDVLKNGGEYGFINEYLGLYRKHAGNITNIKTTMMNDAKQILDIIEVEMPQYKKSVTIARSTIIEYGYAYQYLEIGDNKNAIKWFLKSIRGNPLQYKAYIRIFQLIVLSIKNKVLNK